MRKCCLKTDKEEIVPFCFGQFDKQWFYIYTTEVKNSDALKKVGCSLHLHVGSRQGSTGWVGGWGKAGDERGALGRGVGGGPSSHARWLAFIINFLI